MESILFQHAGTLGVRWRMQSRTILDRAAIDVETPWGLVPGKVYQLPDGQVLFSPEYEACREIANEEGIRLVEVTDEVRACYASHAEGTLSHSTSDELEPIDAPKLFEERQADDDSEESNRNRVDAGDDADVQDEANWYRWDSSPWNDN